DQVQVVDLDGRRGGLVGLVDALEDGGHQPAGAAEDLRGPLDLGGRDVADLGGPPGGALLDGGGEVVEADGVRVDGGAVGPAGADELVQQRVEQGHVGAGARREVHVGPAGDGGEAGVDADQRGRVGAVQAVQHPHPQHRLGLGDVVSEHGEGVGVVDVLVGAGRAVAAEGLLEGLGGRGGAQPGVAVAVVGADAAVREDGEGVVLLQDQLPGGVVGAGVGRGPVAGVAGGGGDPVRAGVPVRLPQAPVFVHEGTGRAVGGGVGGPAVEVLGAEPAAVAAVDGAAAYADDAAVAHGDVDR